MGGRRDLIGRGEEYQKGRPRVGWVDMGWELPVRADINTPLVVRCIRCYLRIRRTFAKGRG